MIRQNNSDGQQPPAKRFDAIDVFDRELVKFVLSWAPYGLPPEDEVLPRFGIGSDRLYQRVHEIAFAGLARNLHDDDRALLLRALALLKSATKPRAHNGKARVSFPTRPTRPTRRA